MAYVVLEECTAGVLHLRLQRGKVNAVNLDLVHELGRVVERLPEYGDRALVVTGAGACFCAGLDTKEVPAYTGAQHAEMLRTINRTLTALYAFPGPVVCAINGHALGAGLVLALACDYRIAADTSLQLGLPEVTAGIPFPAVPMRIVRAQLDPGVARFLCLTGRSITPEQALARGIVDELRPLEGLVDRATQAAESLRALPGHAIVKRQLRGIELAEMEQLSASGADPMLEGWVVA